MEKNSLIYSTLAILASAAIYLSFEAPYDPICPSAKELLCKNHQVIAHKGFISGDFAGNSWEAFEEAAASEAQGIEMDVRMTKDNVFFLYHDDTLEELTDGHGKPEDCTWEELSRLTHNAKKPSHFAKLEEVFKLVGSTKIIFLDTKFEGFFNKKICENLAQLILKYNLQKTVFVQSFNPFFMRSMRTACRDIFLMYDSATDIQAFGEEKQRYLDKIPWALRQPWVQKQIRRLTKPDALDPRFTSDKKILKALIEHGYPVVTWTIDDPATAKAFFDLGIRGIKSNTPLPLLKEIPKAYFEKEPPAARGALYLPD